ncbi:conserved hypothetical protein [Thiomonas arsenitoxydans]|uniref:Uncharacterized protein n=1 Tax=Thiomonas arsenitoxydans (strain DSM 22701 / CIP 110005 / 3As) TaxID=426114 RepID=D6CQ54_THIA3|nr:hypothetical protein THI_1450 [Thiomonas arsenitoxydans]CQR32450.1 conserved hypothetical protein [Thiomonas arsenitoxydans]CQR32791.1 conserved hypothetical protein [Thiomonas arsenitoxydans]CQR34204.1 conserved hypothetical protein [Thiomonas arsenitoxydans]CQR40491.1 conserved hypothetical protein [Thiomonas arsenitoxydans]
MPTKPIKGIAQDGHVPLMKGYVPLKEGHQPVLKPSGGHQPSTSQQKPFVPAPPPKKP